MAMTDWPRYIHIHIHALLAYLSYAFHIPRPSPLLESPIPIMSWGYLALPAELQDRTLVFIAPVLAKPRVKATLSNQLETDIDSVFECAKNIKDFALTCKAVFKRCAPLLYDVRSLKCGRERVLIEEHPDGTVYPVLKFTT